MAGTKHVEVYKDADGKWRYRVKARNGRIVAASEQGFARKFTAKRRARKDYPELPIEE